MAQGEVVQISDADRKAHEADEAIIDRGLATFVEVGRALMRIRDRRSYLMTHSTFGGYVRERWRFNAPYAYNLMLGAEVIDVLEGAEVEVMPANARVAYELRTLVDEPERLIEAWRKAVAEHGDKPLGREVARIVRGDDGTAPKLDEREADDGGRLPAEVAENMTRDQDVFLKALVDASVRLESAKSVQRAALRDVDPKVARAWGRRVKRLRTIATDLQRAIDRKS